MDVMQKLENIKAHLEADAASVKERLEGDLPGLAEFVSSVASNPVTQAISTAVHLNAAPEVLNGIAQMIGLVEASLAAQHAAGVTEGQQAAVQPPAEAPADPAPDAPPSA